MRVQEQVILSAALLGLTANRLDWSTSHEMGSALLRVLNGLEESTDAHFVILERMELAIKLHPSGCLTI